MLIKVMKLFLGATNCLSDIPNSVHWLSFFNFLPSGHSLLNVSFEFDLISKDTLANFDINEKQISNFGKIRGFCPSLALLMDSLSVFS